MDLVAFVLSSFKGIVYGIEGAGAQNLWAGVWNMMFPKFRAFTEKVSADMEYTRIVRFCKLF